MFLHWANKETQSQGVSKLKNNDEGVEKRWSVTAAEGKGNYRSFKIQ